MAKNNKLFEILNDISYGKKGGLIADDSPKDYAPFVINRFLSASLDCLMYANEMNRMPWLNPVMQYEYLRRSIRPKKRFLEWPKSTQDEAVENIQIYYGLSYDKAKQVLNLHSDEQIAYIKQRLSKGGMNKND